LSKGFKCWCVIFFPMIKFVLVGNAYKHQHKYWLVFAFFNKCRTMVDNVANKVDYGQLLKLKTDMFWKFKQGLERTKSQKKMYYSIQAQTKLLNVCELKDFKTSLVFKNLGKVNGFAWEHTQNKIMF
jgi:hypothetical protein